MTTKKQGTVVCISLFKQTGFEYCYFIPTLDRGKAIQTVIDYHKKEGKYINYVRANLSNNIGSHTVLKLKEIEDEE
jgi:hypothetical protein